MWAFATRADCGGDGLEAIDPSRAGAAYGDGEKEAEAIPQRQAGWAEKILYFSGKGSKVIKWVIT